MSDPKLTSFAWPRGRLASPSCPARFDDFPCVLPAGHNGYHRTEPRASHSWEPIEFADDAMVAAAVRSGELPASAARPEARARSLEGAIEWITPEEARREYPALWEAMRQPISEGGEAAVAAAVSIATGTCPFCWEAPRAFCQCRNDE